VVTGDVTQTDLPRGQMSGLIHALKVLAGIDEIGFCYFTAQDVVRHPLVQSIVRAYDEYQRSEQGAETARGHRAARDRP
jgi:phosphate starvation-inducible protein PhoH and related proteins